MIKFYKISTIEKLAPYVDAVAGANVANYAGGSVTAGVFAVAAKGGFYAAQVEKGDDAFVAPYTIAKNDHVRLVDLTKIVGEQVLISPSSYTGTIGVGNKLAFNASGILAAGTPSSGDIYFSVDKINVDFDGAGILATVAVQGA